MPGPSSSALQACKAPPRPRASGGDRPRGGRLRPRAGGGADAELEAAAAGARAAWAAARTGAGLPTTAVQAMTQLQYAARLEAAAQAAVSARDTHRVGALALAIRGAEAARAAHLVARQRREMVDKALSRREAAARLDMERRTEAELDDRARPPRG